MHDRSQSRAPPILVHKYMDENSSAAMQSMQARGSTLDLKPRTDITVSPKHGYQWPRPTRGTDDVFKKFKEKKSSYNRPYNRFSRKFQL